MEVFIGAPCHFILAFLPFATTPVSEPASLPHLSIMSSQQDAQRPNARDPSSPRASEAEKLIPAMEGAASRSPTSEHIRTRLDELWGRGAWIPTFSHKLTGQRLTVDSFSHHDLQALLSISNKAAGRGIALTSLYEPRGLIYRFVRKVNGVPKWTDDVVKKAKRRADNLWKGGQPRVALVTHPRVPRSERTSEQTSAISSDDTIDLVSDDEETLHVESFDDRNEDTSLRNESNSEESHTTPLDQQPDVSNINRDRLIPPHPVIQSAAPDRFLDIPGARAQLKNGKSLSDEDVIDLIRHLRHLSV